MDFSWIGDVVGVVDDLWVSPQEEFAAREARYERETALELARLQAQSAAVATGGTQNAVVTGASLPSWLPWVALGGGLLLVGAVLVAKG